MKLSLVFGIIEWAEKKKRTDMISQKERSKNKITSSYRAIFKKNQAAGKYGSLPAIKVPKVAKTLKIRKSRNFGLVSRG